MITTAQQAPWAVASGAFRVKNTFVHIETEVEFGDLEIDASAFRRMLSEPSPSSKVRSASEPASSRPAQKTDHWADISDRGDESTEDGFEDGTFGDEMAAMSRFSSGATTQDSLPDVARAPTDGSLPAMSRIVSSRCTTLDTLPDVARDPADGSLPEAEPFELHSLDGLGDTEAASAVLFPMLLPPMLPPSMWPPSASFSPMPPPWSDDPQRLAMVQGPERRSTTPVPAPGQRDRRKSRSLITMAQRCQQRLEKREQGRQECSAAAVSAEELKAVSAAVREQLGAEGTVASAKFCVFCGGAVKDNFRFCRFCGATL